MSANTARLIDLRSDTVTKPTPAMRQVMALAEVGDDVLGDDPTVRQLEEETAELLGKEAALFVPSGTMANQIALRIHTRPGDEVFVDAESHMYYYESGGPAALAGVTCRCLAGTRGIFTGGQLEAAIRPSDVHFPRPALVCIENTHNRGGGAVWSAASQNDVAGTAKRHGLALHMDGARIWNAAIALGVKEREIAAPFDSLSVCYSKGLGAPVGSALVGSRALIDEGRRHRKQLGGAMRQSGIIAAGALFALRHNRARLAEDHANAKHLAGALARTPGFRINPAHVETNLVTVDLDRANAAEIAARLKAMGVCALATGPARLRFVTSLEVSAADIQTAIDRIATLLE